jgi:hypothetical protein
VHRSAALPFTAIVCPEALHCRLFDARPDAHGRSAVNISSRANGALGEQRELFQCLLNAVGWAGLKDGNRI